MSGTQTPEFNLHALSGYSLFSVRGEDVATVLTSYVTFMALLVSAAFLTGIQLVGEPIECWCPAQTSDSMCNYTKSFCWISRQYVIDFENVIPMEAEAKEGAMKREMGFYPMVPFILLAVAVCIRLPTFLKDAFQDDEGLNIPKAVNLALRSDRDDEDYCSEVAGEMSFNLKRRCRRNRAHVRLDSVLAVLTAGGLFVLGRELGTYQTGLFLLTRLATLVVLAAVYPALDYALRTDFSRWGWDLLRWATLDLGWEAGEPGSALVFPRETLCDFQVRQMENVHRYTVQCVLPINLWTEKVFLALWFWLALLLLANVYSYQYWLRRLLMPHHRHALVLKHLAIAGQDTKGASDFAFHYLNHDSVLVLRVLEMAAGSRCANVVVRLLWHKYQGLRAKAEERKQLLSGALEFDGQS